MPFSLLSAFLLLSALFLKSFNYSTGPAVVMRAATMVG